MISQIVAYKGFLGISKDFGVDVSHNHAMALMIYTYLKDIRNKNDINIFNMYDLFLSHWNREQKPRIYDFERMSAKSLLIILDTLDILLSEHDIPNDSFLLYHNEDILSCLEKSACWGDVNKYYKEMLLYR